MRTFQLDAGAIRHGDLVLEARLQGEDRARAHAQLLLCTDPSSRANGKVNKLDAQFAAIFMQDPSLMLEAIPSRYPLQRTGAQAWANADPVWKNMSAWYGTWLRKAVDVDCDLAVAVALKQGIHPDDADVWPEGTLLGSDGWATTPSRLDLALRHGAKPDRAGADWTDGYLYKALSQVKRTLNLAHEQDLFDAVRCVHRILDAGARVVDPPAPVPQPVGQVNFHAKLLSSIGMLTDGNGALMGREPVRGAIFGLAARLQHVGADIDRRNGGRELPPVVQSLRCLNIDFACQLVRMGCKTSDGEIVRPNGIGGVIEPLMVEAQKAGGDKFRTRLLAATMERRVAVADAPESAAVHAESALVARPRRMRAV